MLHKPIAEWKLSGTPILGMLYKTFGQAIYPPVQISLVVPDTSANFDVRRWSHSSSDFARHPDLPQIGFFDSKVCRRLFAREKPFFHGVPPKFRMYTLVFRPWGGINKQKTTKYKKWAKSPASIFLYREFSDRWREKESRGSPGKE